MKSKVPWIVSVVLLAIIVGLMAYGIARGDAITDAECLPFASSQWVLTNQTTGEQGKVTEMSFNPPGTCQFVVQFKDGSLENKVVLSVSERARIRAEQEMSKLVEYQNKEVVK